LVQPPADRYKILSADARAPLVGDEVVLDQAFTSPNGLGMVLVYFPELGASQYEAQVYESELGPPSDVQIERPQPRLVALARFWLIVLGCLWCALGLVVAIDVGGELQWPWLALLAVGVLHLVAARYAKDRIAVLFASFGP
jgi:hypothetical protein